MKRGGSRPRAGKPVCDEALVRVLYAEHAGPLLRYALQLAGGDRRRAEDIARETLLRAWLHPEEIADPPARPWLFAVAKDLPMGTGGDARAQSHDPEAGSPSARPNQDQPDDACPDMPGDARPGGKPAA